MLDKLRNAVLLVVGGLVAVWAISGLVGVVQGGPMDPWAPPGSTYKDLGAVEPRTPIWQPESPAGSPLFTIGQPGSYYLGQDLTGTAGEYGIVIAADNVTLDLNGFSIIGVPGSLDGVHVNCGDELVPLPCYNISIYNGSVSGWGEVGVDGNYANESRFEDLRVTGNGSGLVAAFSLVSNVVATWNGATGIAVSTGTVTNTLSENNGGDGFSLNFVVVTDSFADWNGGDGVDVWNHSLVTNCRAEWNEGDGFEVGADNVVTDNGATGNDRDNDNDGAGIHVTGDNNRIEGNNVTENEIGIDVDNEGNLIIKNSAAGNPVNYSIVASNTVGPELFKQDPITSENPWANFSY